MQGLSPSNPYPDPCSPNGLNDNLTVHLDLDQLNQDLNHEGILQSEQNLYFSGTGEWDKCYAILTEFTKNREHYFKSCSADDLGCPDSGIKMPPMPMQNSEFYGFSEFWYTMEDVARMGGPYLLDRFASACKVSYFYGCIEPSFRARSILDSLLNKYPIH